MSRMWLVALMVFGGALPARAHALGGTTSCRGIVEAWHPPVRAVLAEARDQCVWSFFVNGTDVWWQAGSTEQLTALLQDLRPQLTPISSALWSAPTALVRVHEGRPTVTGMGYAFPDLEADWRIALEGRTHLPPGMMEPSGEDGQGFDLPRGDRRLVAVTVDVWLWRLSRDELQIPAGFVVEDAAESVRP